jgi:hypothetical protein
VSQVVVGAISDQLGLAAGWDVVEARHAGRSFDVRRTHWSCPADKFRSQQSPNIALEAGHFGPRIGAIRNLELRGGKLWAIGEVDPGWDLTGQPWQLSYQLTERRDGWFDLEAVAVVDRTASVCMPTVEVWDGTLAEASRRVVYQHGLVGQLIRNADEDARGRKRGDAIEIRRATPTVVDYTPTWRDYAIETRPRQTTSHETEWRKHGPGARIEWSRHPGRVLRVY